MPRNVTTSQTHDAPVAGDPRERGQLLVINANGTYRLVGHGNEPLGLAVMQGLVDGLIERVSTPDFDLWVNEEGLLRDDFDPNVGASWLLNRHGAPGYTIVGPAFVAANNGEEAIPAEPLVIAAAITLLEELGYEPQDPDPQPPIAGGSGAEDSVFAEHTDLVEYFQELDPTAIDQSNGNFYTKADQFQPCCVGAHIAYVLDTFRYLVGDPAEHCSFTEGMSTLAADLNLSTSQLDHLLHAAGASHDPFSQQLWPLPVATVFTNLLAIEDVPTEEEAELMHDRAVMAYTAGLPPIAGGSGEEEVPERWSTADQAQRREALHFKHCATCEEHSLARCAVGLRLATVTDAAFAAAMGNRPAVVAGGSGEEEPPIAACWPVAEYFAALPPGSIDQSLGSYRVNRDKFEPCCVGAHLAYFFQTEPSWKHYPEAYHDFLAGAERFAELLGITRWQLEHLLFAAGAHVDPFSSQTWPLPAHQVFANLMRIETVPDFEQAQAMNNAAIAAHATQRPPIIAGGSGEEDRLFAACSPIVEYFTQLPPDRIDQDNGGYRPNEHFEPCCVGAHLAYFLGTELLHPETPTRSYHSFMDGQQAFRKFLNVDHADMLNLLWAAGAHHSPFSNQAWPIPAAAVFRNLLTIETIPTFEEAQELHEQAVQRYAATHPPIAGGSGEEPPLQHDYRVTVRENMTEEREWVLSATDEADARERYSEGEDVDSRTIETHSTSVRNVEHETLYCEGCYEERRRGATPAERPPIAGGSGADPVGDAILAVRQLLTEPEHWTRGAPYRNSEGVACQVQNATRYCLSGAIYLSSTSPDVRKGVYRRLMRAMPKRFDEVSLVAFNDGAGRTHADILELLDAATRPPIAGGSGEGPAEYPNRCHGHMIESDAQGHCGYCGRPPSDPLGPRRRLRARAVPISEVEAHPTKSLLPRDHLPPIGGGSIEAGCIGRSRCIVQKQYEWCWAHEPACHAAFCHCIDSTPATEAAYEEQLRQDVRRPALPAATPPETVATVDHEYGSTDAWLRSLINGTGSQDDNDAITAKRIALRREWEEAHAAVCHGCDARICTVALIPIAGGSGEAEPIPFVAPTDSHDEPPLLHHFHVETRELLATDRTWFVTARSEDAIRQHGEFNWEELVKEDNEELIEKQVHEIEHDSDCPACEGTTPGIRWSGTELPPIAGGSGEEEPMHEYQITTHDTVLMEKRYLCRAPSEEAARNEGSIDWEWVNESEIDTTEHTITKLEHLTDCEGCTELPPIGGGAVGTPKLRWEAKGRGGGKEYHSGKYVIFHPYDEAHLKSGRGGILISKKWRLNYSTSHWDRKEHKWLGEETILGTYATVQEAKRAAQAHADDATMRERPDAGEQLTLRPIAGGSGELEVEVTIQGTFTKKVTITPSDVAHDVIAAEAAEAFFDAFNDCTDLAKHDIECDFGDGEYHYDPPYPPIAGGSGEEEPRFASCWPVAAYFAALPEDAWNQNQGDYYVKPDQFNPCCVGAHLAYFLHTTLLGTICPHHSFTDGRFALAKQLRLGIHALDTLLYAAGAHYRPFGPEQWPVPPAQVFANLLSIESVPTDHDAVEMHHKAVHAHAGALPPIAGGSGEDEQFLDDIARDHVAMGTVEVEDIKTCLHCQASVLPWQLQCQGCGSSTPFTPPAPPRWFCTDCGLDDHESEEDAELCCRPPIAGGSGEAFASFDEVLRDRMANFLESLRASRASTEQLTIGEPLSAADAIRELFHPDDRQFASARAIGEHCFAALILAETMQEQLDEARDKLISLYRSHSEPDLISPFDDLAPFEEHPTRTPEEAWIDFIQAWIDGPDPQALPAKPLIAGGSGEDPPPRRRLTTRERRTNRLHRREEWADSRARKKDAAITTWEQRRQAVPPMGEPIKVGHHSEGKHRKAIKRVDQALDKVVEHDAMLGKHERAAGAIARELERSIYDDDVDAIPRLQERIAALEAQRDRRKAINAWLTKHGGIPRRRVPRGSPDELYAKARDALQRCKEAMQLTDEECRRLPDMLLYSETLGYPPYALSNLSGNIRRQVKRLERLEREAGDAAQS